MNLSGRRTLVRTSAALVLLAAAACGGDSPTGGEDPPPTGTAPQIVGISPGTLVPGGTATITGTGFSASAAGNTVTIGGVQAPVTAATATQLQVAVPCALSGGVAVQVTTGGVAGTAVTHQLLGNRRTLAPGQAALITSAAETGCNELTAAGGPARYVLAIYNVAPSPGSLAAFRVSGDGVGAAGPVLARASLPRAAAGGPGPLSLDREAEALQRSDRAHAALMEKNRQEFARLSARFANAPRAERSPASPAPPPASRSFRVSNINAPSICANFYTVQATRVYYDGRIAIYQDDANPITTSHPTLGATMQSYYDRIGQQFNSDMDPIISTNFGNVLRRDAVTDNNGVLVALFTNTINTEMPNLAGFVVSCDQFPNDESGTGSNSASNYGEYFYAYVPTSAETGYNSLTPDAWYRVIRSTFIHEAKHVASQAARAANGTANWEVGWLEEGTARHAEELWARQFVYGVAWKGNTGYGSAAAPGSVYCDVRPTTAACLSMNSRRPSVNMQRHFAAGGLYEFLGNPSGRSPFGRPEGDEGASFYASAWSLARYAVDRYAGSEAAFFTALNQSSLTGMANLTAVAGASAEELLGGWALSLYADDYPGLAAPQAELRFPTWNLRDIFAGLKADFPTGFPRETPIVADQVAFGAFGAVNVPNIVGGGVKYVEISGNQSAGQLIRLEGAAGGAAPSSLRVAIARLQ